MKNHIYPQTAKLADNHLGRQTKSQADKQSAKQSGKKEEMQAGKQIARQKLCAAMHVILSERNMEASKWANAWYVCLSHCPSILR